MKARIGFGSLVFLALLAGLFSFKETPAPVAKPTATATPSPGLGSPKPTTAVIRHKPNDPRPILSLTPDLEMSKKFFIMGDGRPRYYALDEAPGSPERFKKIALIQQQEALQAAGSPEVLPGVPTPVYIEEVN